MDLLESTIARILPADSGAMEAARARQDSLTKPRGSLGRLEELSLRIAGMQARSRPRLGARVVFVMAGDHGVCAEGVSAFPQEVTPQMVANFLGGGAGINVLARQAGARVVVTDVGVASDLAAAEGLYLRKVGQGTANMAKGPAMTREEARLCVEVGIEVFETEFAKAPFAIAATGDMGIGNTTPATALASVLLGARPETLIGRGTGVDDAGLKRKLSAIEGALAVNRVDRGDALGVLAALGGFEIGALAGLILAAAARRIPILIDGFISGSAALLARAFSPLSVDYMIAAHLSGDSGHRLMLEALGQKPLLDLALRLGEGTGAALAFNLCEAACLILDEMATFGEAGVSDKED